MTALLKYRLYAGDSDKESPFRQILDVLDEFDTRLRSVEIKTNYDRTGKLITLPIEEYNAIEAENDLLTQANYKWEQDCDRLTLENEAVRQGNADLIAQVERLEAGAAQFEGVHQSEIECLNSHFEEVFQSMREDAELGLLVRAMPNRSELKRYKAINGTQWAVSHHPDECKPMTAWCMEPDEALRAAGVGTPVTEGQETPTVDDIASMARTAIIDAANSLGVKVEDCVLSQAKPWEGVVTAKQIRKDVAERQETPLEKCIREVEAVEEEMRQETLQKGKEYCPATSDHFCPKTVACDEACLYDTTVKD